MIRPELHPDVDDPKTRAVLERNALTFRQMQSPPVARLTKSGGFNQSLTAGVEATVTLSATATNAIDTHGYFDDSSDRYIARETGYYRFSAQARFTTFSAAATVIRLSVKVNNATYSRAELNVTATTQSPTITTSGVVWLEGKPDGTSNYYIELLAESTLADATIDGSHTYTHLNIEYIGADQIR